MCIPVIINGVEYIDGFALGYSTTASTVHDSDYHVKNDYEIMYLRRGKRKVFVKDVSYRAAAGNVLFIDKNTLHKTAYLCDEYERFVINFTDGYLLPSVKEHISPLFEQVIYRPENIGDIDRLCFSMQDEWDRFRCGDKLAKDAISADINLLLLKFIRSGGKWACSDAKTDNPAIELIVRYINDNYRDDIDLTKAASKIKMSPTQLSRLFHRYTGFKFTEYLNAVRIEHAKTMLEETRLPVSRIAADCGFNDSNYFSTVLRKNTGVSPREYRKRALKKE